MEYLFVAVGGVFGSLSRFFIGQKIAEKASANFPVGTFVINITGAFLLGAVSFAGLSKNMYAIAGVGFLGAYTTFSTFMYEGFCLFQSNKKLNAAVYILSSLILGILGYFLGFQLMSCI